MQPFLDAVRQGGLTRAGEPGEPDHDAFVAIELLTPGTRDRGVMPDRVLTLRRILVHQRLIQ